MEPWNKRRYVSSCYFENVSSTRRQTSREFSQLILVWETENKLMQFKQTQVIVNIDNETTTNVEINILEGNPLLTGRNLQSQTQV